MSGHPGENQEWVEDRVFSWVETYKKAMLTPVILSLVSAHQPTSIADIAEGIVSAAGWQVTERGLYRTLKRLQAEGLLHGTDVDAPRTGAKRRELSLTDLGAEFLTGVTEHLVDPSSID